MSPMAKMLTIVSCSAAGAGISMLIAIWVLY